MIMDKECFCGTKLEFDAGEINELTCPKCGRAVIDLFKGQSVPQPESNGGFEKARQERTERFLRDGATSEKARAGSDEETALNVVRSKSCYRTLRGLINTVIMGGYFICGLFVVALVIGSIGAALSGTLPAEHLAMTWVAAFVVMGAAVVLLMAIKQGLLLLIDGVDLLVAERVDRIRREHETKPETSF
ncbi:MAG TPA: hypothetical protein VM680_18525 [Verrucomicrobiae bacterium]|nr:hypothetical protein [Verrucomicrobiae bacterium]